MARSQQTGWLWLDQSTNRDGWDNNIINKSIFCFYILRSLAAGETVFPRMIFI